MTPIDAFDMVLFGGTGDLVMRKLLPALYHQHRDGNLPKSGRIICLGRSVPDNAAYLDKAHGLAKGYLGKDYEEDVWAAFAARVEYLKLDANDPAEYSKLADKLNEQQGRSRVFYLSTAPDLFARICKALSDVGLARVPNTRVVLEKKPLGHDLESSNEINDAVAEYFDEQQIYRIDHYLGKEPVLNLIALRFANTLLEPLWRREWIRDVQITVTEQVGVETRADFYDKTGALRDMIQNHLLQLLTIVAMEPPASIDADAVRDEKLKVLRALKPLTQEDVHTKVFVANTVPVPSMASRCRAIKKNRACRLAPRPKPLSRSRLKSRPGVGQACRSSCAPASVCKNVWPRLSSTSAKHRTRSTAVAPRPTAW